MTATTGRAAAPTRGGGTPASGRRLIAVLAVTATVGYGVLFYTFSVVLHPMAADLRTSTAVITGAYTLSVLAAAAAAIPVGRYLDRHGARRLMTAGAVLGSVSVAALSQATAVWQVYTAFALIGLASAASLYEAAFTVVVHHLGPARRAGAVLAITIVAGFASTVFIPAAGWLTATHDWRAALLALAVVHGLITVPAHALAIPRHAPVRSGHLPPGPGRAAGAGQVLRDRGFGLLAIAFVAHGTAVAAVSVHLVGYLTTLGHPAALAATIAGMLGVLSVTGRILTTGLARRRTITTVAAVVFAGQAAAAATLPLVGTQPAAAIACVVVFGLGFGIGTIVRPAVLVDRYGTTAYGAISGTLTVPITIAKAAAPLAAAAATGTAMMAAVALLCLTAAITLLGAAHAPRPAASGHPASAAGPAGDDTVGGGPARR